MMLNIIFATSDTLEWMRHIIITKISDGSLVVPRSEMEWDIYLYIYDPKLAY